MNLRDLQHRMFAAGANASMIGNYLTTNGRPPEDDIEMIENQDLEVAQPLTMKESTERGNGRIRD